MDFADKDELDCLSLSFSFEIGFDNDVVRLEVGFFHLVGYENNERSIGTAPERMTELI